MEALSHLSIESFSHSWLANTKPSVDSLEGQTRGTFIEMSKEMVSMSTSEDYDFDFNLPASPSPVILHADELFSGGLLLPVHLITPNAELASEAKLRRSLSLDSSMRLLTKSNRYGYNYMFTSPERLISSNSSPFHPSVESTSIPLSARNMKVKVPSFVGCGGTKKKLFRKFLGRVVPIFEQVKGLRLIKRVAGYPVSLAQRVKFPSQWRVKTNIV